MLPYRTCSSECKMLLHTNKDNANSFLWNDVTRVTVSHATFVENTRATGDESSWRADHSRISYSIDSWHSRLRTVFLGKLWTKWLNVQKANQCLIKDVTYRLNTCLFGETFSRSCEVPASASVLRIKTSKVRWYRSFVYDSNLCSV